MGTRFDLEQNGVRENVIADLVAGDPLAHIAARYGVRRQAVFQFRARHQDEVDAALALVRQALAETWTAVKGERVATMTDDVERIEVILARFDRAGAQDEDPLDTDEVLALIRTKTAVLRAIAEELGDIPRAILAQPERSIVTYAIIGPDGKPMDLSEMI